MKFSEKYVAALRSKQTLALADRVVRAVLADEKDGGCDLSAGMFGTEFSALVVELAVQGLKVPDNLESHRSSWLQAFDRLIELEPETLAGDEDQKGYWQHERQAMLDMYADLDQLKGAEIEVDLRQQTEIDRKEALILKLQDALREAASCTRHPDYDWSLHFQQEVDVLIGPPREAENG